MRTSKHLDERDLWRKLLDPIRESYGDQPAGDHQLLHYVVRDLQWLVMEHKKLARIVQEQARVLRRNGLAGYGRDDNGGVR